MSHAYLASFRRRLHDWLNLRLEGGRTPFRRVEELPEVLVGDRLATPDLVLWINRDSLLAGAMIFIPPRVEGPFLLEAGEVALALGLRQFVTWESREINLWQVGAPAPEQLKSWPVAAADGVSVNSFAVAFEQLLLELKNLAVAAAAPAGQLPPAYFANLCRQVLADCGPSLQETARVAAAAGQRDAAIRQAAGDKGWMTLWRMLALRWQDRIPPGVKPERLDRALAYALHGLDAPLHRLLGPLPGEAPLPESAAIRFHHLGGRLAQLGWRDNPVAVREALRLLLAEATRAYRLGTTPLQPPPGSHDLLVRHLPPQPLEGAALVAPQACLAGKALLCAAAGEPLPERAVAAAPLLPSGWRPLRIVAALHDDESLPAEQRRQRLLELRHPWPHRRFDLPGGTPAWLWAALYLGGLLDPGGELHLELPPAWGEVPGADVLWQALCGRLQLTELELRGDGSQRLVFTGCDRPAERLIIRHFDGTRHTRPPLLDDEGLAAVAGLAGAAASPTADARIARRHRQLPAEEIAARVFRDGVPTFPEHYLRRIDLPATRRYEIPGALRAEAHFFDHIRLTGDDGTVIECDNAAAAEALLLAARHGRRAIELPIDPALILQLIDAHRHALRQLWEELRKECRRRQPTQRGALALARRLWRDQGLAPWSD